MKGNYETWYQEFKKDLEGFANNETFEQIDALIGRSKGKIALNHKLMEKAIDVSWVETIENGILHIDNVLRNPGRTIEDVEEIVPIALSKKTTVESVKFLAQHTDMIQSVDKRTGKITPSKILNVYKEESLVTYENRFVNTLIDRLYIFINTRYEKLAEVAKDEEVYSLDFQTSVQDGSGNQVNLNFKVDTINSLEAVGESGYTIWQRVEKLKKTIEGYKGSVFCETLGNNYVRPPIMRTNAIMKNVDMKACLVLWQYVESYDKVGYKVNTEDTVLKPEASYIEDLYKIMALSVLLFQGYVAGDTLKGNPIKSRDMKPVYPKVVKRFGRELLSGDYNIHATQSAGYIEGASQASFVVRPPEDSDAIFEEINKAIEIEKNYQLQKEKERLDRIKAQEEAERRRKELEAQREEKRRIEEAKREERERIRREKEEEERRIQELLERRRAEAEAEERERARLEAERLAKLEEERRQREEEERIAAEKERIAEQKTSMRTNLGDAEGMDVQMVDSNIKKEEYATAYSSVTASELKEVDEELAEKEAEAANHATEEEKAEEEYKDPRLVAAEKKIAQQRMEKERSEKERADRLKEERSIYESKPFETIRKQYSKNPIHAIPRLVKRMLFVLFGYIPKDTDNPEYRRILDERARKKERKETKKREKETFEALYRKYAPDTKYRLRRDIEDIKFKRKRRKAAKKQPKPVYTPPKRTEEETRAIEAQMRAIYKEYHVSFPEAVRRRTKSVIERFKQDDKDENEENKQKAS